MTTVINVLLGLMAGILFIGLCDEHTKRHNHILIAFISVLLFIVAFNTIM